MTDILILFENPSREMENVALLAAELKWRGYKVKIMNIRTPFKFFVKPKVVIVPHLYNNDQLIRFCKNLWMNNNKIIDLQYEQILSKNVNIDDIHFPKGQSKEAHHIAWGKNQVEKYRKSDIASSNIHQTGSIAMDFFHPDFSSYFMKKEELADKFGLDAQKEWILFVSSFAYANLSEERLRLYEKMSLNTREFAKISNESFYIIVDWLKKAAEEFPDKIFIYRKHPAEESNSLINEITAKLPNFYCINDYSMRQWALATDKIYNWYSTSIADIFFAKKTCYILRPISVPEHLEVEILDKARHITRYEKFIESLKSNDWHFPIDNKTIEFYYGKRDDRMAFLQIADICEQLIYEHGKIRKFDYGKSRFNMNNGNSLKEIISPYLNIFFYSYCVLFKIKKGAWILKRKQHEIDVLNSEVYGYTKNFKSYYKRLFPIIKNMHKNN